MIEELAASVYKTYKPMALKADGKIDFNDSAVYNARERI